MTKRGGVQPHQLEYSERIANRLIELSEGGVSRKDMLAAIQTFQNAPRSFTTFYKLYGPLLSEHEADLKGKIGKRVIDKALHGDYEDPTTWKAQEFYLDRKGGWSKSIAVDLDPVDQDVDESAAEALLNLLGFTEEVVEEEKQ